MQVAASKIDFLKQRQECDKCIVSHKSEKDSKYCMTLKLRYCTRESITKCILKQYHLDIKNLKSSRKGVKVNRNTKTGSERKMTPQSGPHVPPIKKSIRNQDKIEYYDGEVIEAQDSSQESRSLIKFKMAILKNSGFLSKRKDRSYKSEDRA